MESRIMVTASVMRTDRFATVYVPATGRYVTTREQNGQAWTATREATDRRNHGGTR